jgi:putative transcriptional regulator
LQTTLTGQFLVAMPSMEDERFAETVIYMCAHGDDGAMGLVINRELPDLQFTDLMDQFELGGREDAIVMPRHVMNKTIHIGGPVETNRGFVLHSSDYHTVDSSLRINEDVSLTATIDVLRAIALGQGPQESLLAMGYCSWSAGQLEGEIKANGWLTVPATLDLIFEAEVPSRYEAALAELGINRARLSPDMGHA